MEGKAVYELISPFDERSRGAEVGAVGIYTGIGVAPDGEPDILLLFDWVAGIEYLGTRRNYCSDLSAVLPTHEAVLPLIREALAALSVIEEQDREQGDALQAFLHWCDDRLAPRDEAAMTALGYG